MERRVEVFFYGLFMDADPLREKGFRPADARRASVEDMALHLGARATLVPERGSRVHGMLMSLTHAEIDRLYAEPSVAAYRPEPVIASLEGSSPVAALCFNLPAVPTGVRSNPEYAAKLRIAAKKMVLPETYIANI
jgi:Gamma-glutamyl cyclotransferase, AIG2-like